MMSLKQIRDETESKLEMAFGSEAICEMGWLRDASKKSLMIAVADIITEEPRLLKVTPADVVYYYAYDARNISSGIRSLAGYAGDWRPIDHLAKECLEIFKVLNRPALVREAKKYGMTLK